VGEIVLAAFDVVGPAEGGHHVVGAAWLKRASYLENTTEGKDRDDSVKQHQIIQTGLEKLGKE